MRTLALVSAHFGHGVAVFDLDRTLIRGSSLSLYGRELVRRGLVPRSTVARLDQLVATLLQAADGRVAEPFFYADSGSDLPLLERCGTAVAVNPGS